MIPEQIETWNQFDSLHVPQGLPGFFLHWQRGKPPIFIKGIVSHRAALLWAALQSLRGAPPKNGEQDNRYCAPTYKYLATLFGQSEDTIATWMAELVNAGLIVRRVRQRGPAALFFRNHPYLRLCHKSNRAKLAIHVRKLILLGSGKIPTQEAIIEPFLEDAKPADVPSDAEEVSSVEDSRVGENAVPSREKSQLGSGKIPTRLKEETVSIKRFLSNGNIDSDHQSRNRQNRDSAPDDGGDDASLIHQNLGNALYDYRRMEPSVRTVQDVFDAGEGATEDEIVDLLEKLKAEGRCARTWKYLVVTVRDRFRTKRAQEIADKQQGKPWTTNGNEPKGYDPNNPTLAAMTNALDGEWVSSPKEKQDITHPLPGDATATTYQPTLEEQWDAQTDSRNFPEIRSRT